MRLDLQYLRGSIQVRAGTPAAGARLLVAAADEAARLDRARAMPLLVAAADAAFLAGEWAALAGLGRIAARLEHDLDGDPAALPALILRMLAAATARSSAVQPEEAGRPGGDAAGGVSGEFADAERLEDPVLLGFAGELAWGIGDDDLAYRLHRKAVARARTLGAAGTLAWALENLAIEELNRGRFAVAEGHALQGRQLALEADHPNGACRHQALLAGLAAYRGHHQQAGAWPRRCWPKRPSGSSSATPPSPGTRWDCSPSVPAGPPRRCTTWRRCGRPARCPVIASWPSSPPQSWSRRPSAPASRSAAVTSSPPTWPGLRRPAPVGARAGRALPRAHLHRRRGRAPLPGGAASPPPNGQPADGARPDRTAVRRVPATPATPRPRPRAAARRAGGVRAARAVGVVRARPPRAARRGPDRPQAQPQHPPAAHPQELQVVATVGEGASNREAAAKLFITPRTVAYHLHSIFGKLGISSRAELVRLAHQSDILRP